MKKYFYVCIIALSLGITSCKKDTTSATVSIGLQPKLQFYANGTLINLDAIRDNTLGWTQSPKITKEKYTLNGNKVFTLSSSDKMTSNTGINLGISLSSILSVQSYPQNINNGNNDSAGKNTDCSILGVYYDSDNSKPGIYTITIMSITNNLVSGTFSGNLIPYYSGNANAVITNGTFSNLPIE